MKLTVLVTRALLTPRPTMMILSQTCVIYRDIDDGPKLTEVSDFVTKQGLGAMTSFLGGVTATGGADECESVASGLKVIIRSLADGGF